MAKRQKLAVLHPTLSSSDTVPASGLTVSGSPPPYAGSGCQYVQMRGEVVGRNCTKGGMSCERRCSYKMEEPECVDDYQVV